VSVVVPAFNEESRINRLIETVRSYFDSTRLSWELVIVDDGSDDGTATMVERASLADSRVRLIRLGHRGKGAAVRRGLMEARGACRFMADADLAVSIDHLPRFLEPIQAGAADVVISSREAAGSERRGESWRRHALGRAFNAAVQALAVPGIKDTQCGFKMLTAAAAEAIMPHLIFDGFAFDVEMLFLARRAGFRIREVGVICEYGPGTRVTAGQGITAFVNILGIRWNAFRGRYAAVSAR